MGCRSVFLPLVAISCLSATVVCELLQGRDWILVLAVILVTSSTIRNIPCAK